MRRTKRLTLNATTIRQLTAHQLYAARGGVGPSVAPNNSCSNCFHGCHTGDAC